MQIGWRCSTATPRTALMESSRPVCWISVSARRPQQASPAAMPMHSSSLHTRTSLSAGSRVDLDGPAECEISSIHDNRDIDCRWRFFDQAQATRFYEPLLARMSSCMREPMQEAEIATRTEGWRILRRHEALLGAEYSQTKVDLLLVDATRRADAEATPDAAFYVQLRVEFEQGD